MDLNRRHLIGASAAGVAGAFAASPEAARAAQLASALGRDATQYGVRPGSPDDQTGALQRAIDEAARAMPLAAARCVCLTARRSLAFAARPSLSSAAAVRCFSAKARAMSA
jgi:phosphodiesterase/alkaline phosphatase D-like protein